MEPGAPAPAAGVAPAASPGSAPTAAPGGAPARAPALRTRPTAEGAIALWFTGVFAIGAVTLGENLVFLLGCLLFGAALSGWAFVRRNLRDLEVVRRAPSRGRVGVPMRLEVELVNPRRRSAYGVEVEDRPESVVRPGSIRLLFDEVPGRGSAVLAPTVVFGRRGWITLGGVVLTSRYPLGLFRATRRVPAPVSVLVRAREGRTTALLRTRLRGGAPEAAARLTALAGDESLYGVREFRQGDDPRRIHWRTTARRGTTTVTEWRSESSRRVVLVLGGSAAPGGRGHRAYERAVSCAATIWRALHREGVPCALALPGKPRDLEGGRRALEAGLDALARVRVRGRRPGPDPLAALARRQGSRFVVYVAARGETGLGSRVAAAAGRGGESLVLRADQGSITRWVRGLP